MTVVMKIDKPETQKETEMTSYIERSKRNLFY